MNEDNDATTNVQTAAGPQYSNAHHAQMAKLNIDATRLDLLQVLNGITDHASLKVLKKLCAMRHRLQVIGMDLQELQTEIEAADGMIEKERAARAELE